MHRAALKTSLVVTAKLALTGASIVAIAWGVGVFGIDGQISPSHADIAWLSPTPRSSTQVFQRSLERLGHHAPQVFDLNGNTVYFSVAYSQKSPDRVFREYQEEFFRQGLNPRPFYDVDGDEDEMMTTALSGGVIPLEISSERIVMGGMVTRDRASDERALKQLFREQQDPYKLFRGHRQIEIHRDRAEARTTILSTWSDEDFDYARMVPGSAAATGADPVVPSCMGCTRLSRFEDLAGDKLHVSSVFQGALGPDELRRFYDQAMRGRGWEPTDTHYAMGTVSRQVDDPSTRGQMFQYNRDGEFLTIVAVPDGTGQTTVVTTLSD